MVMMSLMVRMSVRFIRFVPFHVIFVYYIYFIIFYAENQDVFCISGKILRKITKNIFAKPIAKLCKIVYNGKNFRNDSQLKFYEKKREHIILDPRFDQLLLRTYNDVSEHGVNYVVRKKYLRKLYDEYIV